MSSDSVTDGLAKVSLSGESVDPTSVFTAVGQTRTTFNGDASPTSIKVDDVVQPERCVLEDYVPCRDSHLWKLMMSFYDRKGPDSWSQGIVPHFITSNTFIGKNYAKVLHGFLKDCMSPGAKMVVDPNEPLYIIELGTGKFGGVIEATLYCWYLVSYGVLYWTALVFFYHTL